MACDEGLHCGRKQANTRFASLPLSPHAAYRRNELQAMYVKFETDIEKLNQRDEQQACARSGARLLMTHPGVGPITALATEVFLGDPARFAGSKELASYVGMIPGEYSSGKRQRLGGLTKQGNPLLRFLWSEAAIHAVRRDPELKHFYRRKIDPERSRKSASSGGGQAGNPHVDHAAGPDQRKKKLLQRPASLEITRKPDKCRSDPLPRANGRFRAEAHGVVWRRLVLGPGDGAAEPREPSGRKERNGRDCNGQPAGDARMLPPTDVKTKDSQWGAPELFQLRALGSSSRRPPSRPAKGLGRWRPHSRDPGARGGHDKTSGPVVRAIVNFELRRAGGNFEQAGGLRPNPVVRECTLDFATCVGHLQR
jgi:hypothetical protein